MSNAHPCLPNPPPPVVATIHRAPWRRAQFSCRPHIMKARPARTAAPPAAAHRGAASSPAAASNPRSGPRILSGLLLLALVYVLQLSEAPKLEVHRQATTTLQQLGSSATLDLHRQATTTLQRVQELGSFVGQGIAEAEAEDIWNAWGPEPASSTGAETQPPSTAESTRAEPPPPPQVEPEAALAAAALHPPHRACVAGCHTRGNCNEELGRCDCPPLSEGPACERGVVPKCREQWGMSLPFPPCQVGSSCCPWAQDTRTRTGTRACGAGATRRRRARLSPCRPCVTGVDHGRDRLARLPAVVRLPRRVSRPQPPRRLRRVVRQHDAAAADAQPAQPGWQGAQRGPVHRGPLAGRPLR